MVNNTYILEILFANYLQLIGLVINIFVILLVFNISGGGSSGSSEVNLNGDFSK